MSSWSITREISQSERTIALILPSSTAYSSSTPHSQKRFIYLIQRSPLLHCFELLYPLGQLFFPLSLSPDWLGILPYLQLILSLPFPSLKVHFLFIILSPTKIFLPFSFLTLLTPLFTNLFRSIPPSPQDLTQSSHLKKYSLVQTAEHSCNCQTGLPGF